MLLPNDALAVFAGAYPVAMGLAAFGSALGLGWAISSAMNAMGRQPEVAGKIQTAMMIACAFIEMLTLYVMIAGLMILNKLT